MQAHKYSSRADVYQKQIVIDLLEAKYNMNIHIILHNL